MTSAKLVLMSLTFAVLLTICNCSILSSVLENLFENETGKRSMSEAVTKYLDYLFPKDDRESRIMKEIFSFFADDSYPGLEGAMDALSYLK